MTKPRTIKSQLTGDDMTTYGACEVYGKKSLLQRLSDKLFPRSKKGWGTVGIKNDPDWDRSEEEQ